MKDNLKIFARLRTNLISEKSLLESRLKEINAVLSESSGSPNVVPAVKVSGKRARARAKNALSLRSAVEQVTKERPLSKEEILSEIQKLGYRFSTSNPTNSLNTILYTGKNFKRMDGKFQTK